MLFVLQPRFETHPDSYVKAKPHGKNSRENTLSVILRKLYEAYNHWKCMESMWNLFLKIRAPFGLHKLQPQISEI